MKSLFLSGWKSWGLLCSKASRTAGGLEQSQRTHSGGTCEKWGQGFRIWCSSHWLIFVYTSFKALGKSSFYQIAKGLPLCSLLITVTISEGKQSKRRMDIPGLYPNSTRPQVDEISLNVMTVEPPDSLASSEPGRKRKKKMRKKKRWKKKVGRKTERWWWWRGRVRGRVTSFNGTF